MNSICDLVLLSWNHLEETRPCLESLFATTDMPCRLFIVDNGSEPAVRQFLSSVKPQGAIQEVVLLQNETNAGFPKGMNRGIRASSAPFVCLLNNDLVFTPGWLSEMIAVARSNPVIGVVNPASSTLGNFPARGVSLNDHAMALKAQHGEYTEVGMCIGFCFLIKRELLDRIGPLTEEVERIFFEDEDFCMRATEAGFQNVVAEASYVYHAEHKTVRKMPEREALFARNRDWLREKWGRRLRIAWQRQNPLILGSDDLRSFLQELVAWARKRTLLYVYSPGKDSVRDALFRSVDLTPHADIHWHAVPPLFSSWHSAMRILMRRKKRFDIIISKDPAWQRMMCSLQWWHGAVVVSEDPHAIEATWKKLRSLW